MRIPKDVIIQLENNGSYILFNVWTRDAVAVETGVLSVIASLQKRSVLKIKKEFSNQTFKIWDIGYFSNIEGLLADPTPWIRELKKWPPAKTIDVNSLINILQEKHIIIDNNKKYRDLFNRKTSLLDKDHLGNFHEQLGQKLILENRVDPSGWWVRQKFTKNYKDLNDTLYKAVQGKFLEKFFKEKFSKSDTVVDIGCGTGFYAKQISKYAGSVVGVDPNADYIKIAQQNPAKNLVFHRAEIGTQNSLKIIDSSSIDYVFMSDALLFYFVSPDPKTNPDSTILFNEIKRVLKPNGRFLSIEPHGIFWLQPWLGELDRPFTIITEYFNKYFRVTPNINEIIKKYLDADFILKDIKEIKPDPYYEKKDRRGYLFAKEFPLWWFFELENKK